jgi:hypothetical protein
VSAASQTPYINPPRVFTTTIVDDDGNPHEYTTTRLPSGKARQVSAMLSVVLGGALDGSIGWSSVLQGLGLSLIKFDVSQFDTVLMSQTTRDGVNLGGRVDLENVSSQGGFGEYVRALTWVVRVNFEPVFLDGLKRIVGTLESSESLAGSLLTRFVGSLSPMSMSTGPSGESSMPDSEASER